MIFQKEITIPAGRRGCRLITREIADHLPSIEGNGILHVFMKHTSAGLTINENADPSVRDDFEGFLDVAKFNHKYCEPLLPKIVYF
jgi:thiamine phosphate synthase YjbQ (UPF0047 family)